MTDSTRRRFLTLAGSGAFAGAAMVAAPLPKAGPAVDEVRLPAEAAGPLAAFVRDVRSDDVALMIEGREVVVTDPELVARLARAYAGAAGA